MKDFIRKEFLRLSLTLGAGFFLSPYRLFAQTPLPNVLIIGDSISMGYTPIVKELLKTKANVLRPDENCAATNNGVKKIDKWIANNKYAVIHFNFGLHDLKHADPKTGTPTANAADPRLIDVDAYKNNLEQIIQKLKETGATLIFATTTPVPEMPGNPFRDMGDPEIYNKAAKKVMKRNRVKIDDLYGFALPQIKDIQLPDNVHFTDNGYKILGAHVAESIANFL